MLAPKEEEQLHDAAELLVKQTRRTRTQSIGGDSSDATSAASSRPSTSSSNDHGPKRKNRGSQNTDPETLVVESAPLVQHAPILPPLAPAPKSRKRKPKEEEIDESLLNPEEAEALRKKRIKSAKLSESLRKRWEKGEMAGAMETRKATNAAKKAKKAAEQAAAAATARGMPLEPAPYAERNPTPPQPPPYQPIQRQPTTPLAVETPISKRKQPLSKKSSSKGKKPAPLFPPVRQPSTRTRKPARHGLYDGSDDHDEPDQQLQTEYEHFQALTSPGSPVVLGKRVRKSKIDLAAAMGDNGEDEDDYY
ncbi:hypothetical protein G7Y89_g14521 [Cudoniella acicularis]|uniref:Uncharacterized protein n=1 Tax=Cudoniella acicularis TaxID=354080 RepID=A0A8H4R3C3_9HELO|nr:hypothetical protein G7Y89_g14521 [Cudoniella acicularis]